MPNYKKMYFALFNAVTNVVHELQEAQQKSEEAYIGSAEVALIPPKSSAESNKPATE